MVSEQYTNSIMHFATIKKSNFLLKIVVVFDDDDAVFIIGNPAFNFTCTYKWLAPIEQSYSP